MAFLKAQGFFIGIGVVCLASLAAGGWAYMSGEAVLETMRNVDGVVEKARRLQSTAANKNTIEAEKAAGAQRQADFERRMGDAVEAQKYCAFYEQIDEEGNRTPVLREPLVPNVLPQTDTERDNSSERIKFRERYKQEFKRLYTRLRARDRPKREEVGECKTLIERNRQNPDDEASENPWGPRAAEISDRPEQERTLTELLREWPAAVAADAVARSIYMYAYQRNVLGDGAFGIHRLASDETAPNSVEIWQAQMSLWIQQDMATAIARCNERRAEKLRRQGVEEPFWVAQMPVKHLKQLSIKSVLGDGGGSGFRDRFAYSFTGKKNNDQMFVVPLQLDLVMEQTALMELLEELCGIGFYTPISVRYWAVKTDPVFLNTNNIYHMYIYGEDPIVRVVIDLEGYYFREVFDPWIPEELKEVLKQPDARSETLRGRRG